MECMRRRSGPGSRIDRFETVGRAARPVGASTQHSNVVFDGLWLTRHQLGWILGLSQFSHR